MLYPTSKPEAVNRVRFVLFSSTTMGNSAIRSTSPCSSLSLYECHQRKVTHSLSPHLNCSTSTEKDKGSIHFRSSPHKKQNKASGIITVHCERIRINDGRPGLTHKTIEKKFPCQMFRLPLISNSRSPSRSTRQSQQSIQLIVHLQRHVRLQFQSCHLKIANVNKQQNKQFYQVSIDHVLIDKRSGDNEIASDAAFLSQHHRPRHGQIVDVNGHEVLSKLNKTINQKNR